MSSVAADRCRDARELCLTISRDALAVLAAQPPHKRRLEIAGHDDAIWSGEKVRTKGGPIGRRRQFRIQRVGICPGDIVGKGFGPEKPAAQNHEGAQSPAGDLKNPLIDHVCVRFTVMPFTAKRAEPFRADMMIIRAPASTMATSFQDCLHCIRDGFRSVQLD